MQIHFLAARGDLEGVRRQLAMGVPIDAKLPYSGETPLMFAAQDHRADLEMLDFLLSQGANPNTSNDRGYTILGLAAKSRNLEKTRYLLQAGADVRLQDRHGYTALIHGIYAQSENTEIIETLLKAGADPKARPYRHTNETAIRVAYELDSFNIIKMLFESGIELADAGWSKLMYAIAYGTLDDIETQWHQEPPALDPTITPSDTTETIWYFCLRVGDLHKARFLLKMGAKRNSNELLAAVVHDIPELTKWLLETGAVVEARDTLFSWTPLMVASSCGATKNMQVLIEAGADVNAQAEYQQTALIVAQNAEAVRILVAEGANKDHIDGMGYSRLKSASEKGEIEIVKTLLEAGANPNVSSTGETPLHMAIRRDQLEIARLLLEAGADPNLFDIDGKYPFMGVLTVEAARLLIEFGANTDMEISDREKLIEHHKDDPEMVRFLKDHIYKNKE